MVERPERRRFLRGAACAGLTLAAGGGLAGIGPSARAQSSSPLSVTPLRGGIARIGGGGGNVVVLETTDGLAVVDSGSPAHARALRGLIGDHYSDLPIRLLFTTHWHLDHSGGNELLGEAGATIVGHHNTRLWMSTEFYVDWEDRGYSRRPESALPTETFYASDPQPREHEIGGRSIRVGHLRQAHTDGDIYVHFPDENLIAAGGAVTGPRYPIIDYVTGGWIGGLIDATSALIEIADDETLIVPDAGPVTRRGDLLAQRDMLSAVRERIESMALEGKGAAEMIEAGVTRDFDERWTGDAALFVSNAYAGLWWGNRLRGIVA